MQIEGSIIIERPTRMKLQVAIFCLLAVAKFGVSKPSEPSTGQPSKKERLTYTQRWSMELDSFRRGLKIKNGHGELVQLTLGNKNLGQEAIVRLNTNVRFLVYTKQNRMQPDELNAGDNKISSRLRSSHFDAARLTIFVTHGWMNDGISEVCNLIRDAYLDNHDVNVIVVDWSDMRVPNYEHAARQALFIGNKIAEMIFALSVHAHMYLKDVTLVGHSMGAHIMGIAGYQTNGEVNTIIALDPAKSLFETAGIGYRLSSSNARYVQVIHTNANHLGYGEPIGHADFYVNDGEHQKGCNKDFACSHSRAYEYFAESLNRPDSFYGSKLDFYKYLMATLISPLGYVFGDKIDARMGGHPADQTLRGVYYVATRDTSPYGLGVSKPSESLAKQPSKEERLTYTQRWSMELDSFRRGLKIKNGKGELVQLTLGNKTLRREAIVRLDTNVRFRVYTKQHRTQPDELNADDGKIGPRLRSSHFDAGRLTVFVTHGWMNDGNSEVCNLIRNAYLDNYDVNVIVVDWSDMRVPNYEYAARQALFIGDKIAEMIFALSVHAHMYLKDVTLVGHSMGAHIMGIAGYQTNGEVNTIIALDPAKPLFVAAGVGHRLSSSNAKYVQVIHTNADHLGYGEPIGHADFYVNDGEHQKGCNKDFACSHSRAYEYFAESLNRPDSFYGSKLDFYEYLIATLISPLGYVFGDKIDARMGGHPADQTLRGVYYVETRDTSPYGRGKSEGKENTLSTYVPIVQLSP